MVTSSSLLSALQQIRQLLTRQEKFRWLGVVFFSMGSSFLEILTASSIILFAQILNQPLEGQKYLLKIGLGDNLSPGRIVFYASIFVGIAYGLKNLFAIAEVFYQSFSIQKINYSFKNRLLNRYAQADYVSYLSSNASEGYQIVVHDTQEVFLHGALAVAVFVSEALIFLGLVGVIIYINPSLALGAFLIGGGLGFLMIKTVLPFFYRLGQNLQSARLYGGQHLLQFFHGFKDVLLMGKKESFIESYQRYAREKTRAQTMLLSLNALPRLVIETLFVGLFIVAIALLALEQESPLQMLGVLGGYFYAGFRLMPGLNRIIMQLNTIKSIIPSLERIYKDYHSFIRKENYINCPKLHFKKDITLRSVSFCYPHTNKNILRDISLSIKKGECIGIVGETGSGKSTLVDLLLGLLRPTTGSVLIDNKFPVNSYQWHAKIGYVPQSIYLTDDTIEANIAFGENKINKTKLNKAIVAAQLHHFVDQLPEGSRTIVGERGIRLSGGERQRIAIARVLYRDPEVLIFDEATSALDNETEEKLMETIYKIRKNRTVIMIAHRLGTLKKCNYIVRMKAGRAYVTNR
jgi:ABC-type multidrug transport system fused ATPase/permease subunit